MSSYGIAFRLALRPQADLDALVPPVTCPGNWKPETFELRRPEMEAARLEKAKEMFYANKVESLTVRPLGGEAETCVGAKAALKKLVALVAQEGKDLKLFGFWLNTPLRALLFHPVYDKGWEATKVRPGPEFIDMVLSSGWNPRMEGRQIFDIASLVGAGSVNIDLYPQGATPEQEALAALDLADRLGIL